MGSGFKTPSLSTFGQIRGPIVDAQGNVTPVFQRYLSMLEAKTNQTLSIAGNTVLNNVSNALFGGGSVTTNAPPVLPDPLAGSLISITTKGNPILIIFVGCVSNNQLGGITQMRLAVDGGTLSQTNFSAESVSANAIVCIPILFLHQGAAGVHTYEIFWNVGLSGGTSTIQNFNFQVTELG